MRTHPVDIYCPRLNANAPHRRVPLTPQSKRIHTYIHTRDAAIKLEDAQAGVATTPQLLSNDGLDAGGEGGALSLRARNECSMAGSRGRPKGKVTVV